MSATKQMGRFAVALGIGAAVLTGGAPPAWADPADSSDSGSSSTSDPSAPTDGAESSGSSESATTPSSTASPSVSGGDTSTETTPDDKTEVPKGIVDAQTNTSKSDTAEKDAHKTAVESKDPEPTKAADPTAEPTGTADDSPQPTTKSVRNEDGPRTADEPRGRHRGEGRVLRGQGGADHRKVRIRRRAHHRRTGYRRDSRDACLRSGARTENRHRRRRIDRGRGGQGHDRHAESPCRAGGQRQPGRVTRAVDVVGFRSAASSRASSSTAIRPPAPSSPARPTTWSPATSARSILTVTGWCTPSSAAVRPWAGSASTRPPAPSPTPRWSTSRFSVDQTGSPSRSATKPARTYTGLPACGRCR